jgi:hypothetical protein
MFAASPVVTGNTAIIGNDIFCDWMRPRPNDGDNDGKGRC